MAAAPPPAYLDDREINWASIHAATFEVRQSLRYEYPGPVEDLHQMLVLVPPDRMSGQVLRSHELTVSPPARPRYGVDSFGNRTCQIALPRVEQSLEFSLRLEVERFPTLGEAPNDPSEERIFRLPSPLTEPNPALIAAAQEAGTVSGTPAVLAGRLCTWVHQRLRYQAGVTDIGTTAADALNRGVGVCQDYAHLMLALCRISGLAARYVSGHLLGEGAMHAWVQVLLPPASGQGGSLLWQPFDPTHGRPVGLPYIDVAVGRDYEDVSPTRGSFRAPYAGLLAQSSKRAGVLAIA